MPCCHCTADPEDPDAHRLPHAPPPRLPRGEQRDDHRTRRSVPFRREPLPPNSPSRLPGQGTPGCGHNGRSCLASGRVRVPLVAPSWSTPRTASLRVPSSRRYSRASSFPAYQFPVAAREVGHRHREDVGGLQGHGVPAAARSRGVAESAVRRRQRREGARGLRHGGQGHQHRPLRVAHNDRPTH